MITSAKNYTKEKQKKQTKKATKTDRQNPRTNGKSKAIQTKSHREAYTYTLIKRGKGKIIYCCSQSPSSQFLDDSLSIQYSTDAGYIKLIVEI